MMTIIAIENPICQSKLLLTSLLNPQNMPASTIQELQIMMLTVFVMTDSDGMQHSKYIRNRKQLRMIIMHWTSTYGTNRAQHISNLRRYRMGIYIGKFDGYSLRNAHLLGIFFEGSLYLFPKQNIPPVYPTSSTNTMHANTILIVSQIVAVDACLN